MSASEDPTVTPGVVMETMDLPDGLDGVTTTPASGYLGELLSLRFWAAHPSFDAGFRDTEIKGLVHQTVSELVSRIDDVRAAFGQANFDAKLEAAGGETPAVLVTVPEQLLELRRRAAAEGAFIHARVVRELISEAIRAVTGGSPIDEEPGAEASFDAALTLVRRTIDTVRAQSVDGWLKLDLAVELFEELAALESVVVFPAGFLQAQRLLAQAQGQCCEVAAQVLIAGLKWLLATILKAEAAAR